MASAVGGAFGMLTRGVNHGRRKWALTGQLLGVLCAMGRFAGSSGHAVPFCDPPPPHPGFEWGAGGGSVSRANSAAALAPCGLSPDGRPPPARAARGGWA
jgi:hypothetical protein